jgi:hypothetical protein
MSDYPTFRIVRRKDLMPAPRKQRGVYQDKKTGEWRANIRRGSVRLTKRCPTEEEALAVRKQFEEQLGPTKRTAPAVPYSNTGLAGISDRNFWLGMQLVHAFNVTYRDRRGKRHNTHVYYGPKSRSRTAALRMAKGIRASSKHQAPSSREISSSKN